MGVGTPPQSFTVLCDTGSPVTWVPNAVWCGSRRGCDGHRGFTASESASSQPDNLTVAVSYGDGSSVTGVYMLEAVTLAGFTVPDAPVALLDAGSSTPASGVFDGLLGLGLSSAVPTGVVAVAAAAGLLPAPVFSFWLNPDPLQPAAGGELLLGAANDAQAAGPRVWANITSAELGGWPVALAGVWVGDAPLAIACGPTQPPCVAAVDTGTSLILGPPADIAAIYAAINAAVRASRVLTRRWRFWPGTGDGAGGDCAAAAAHMPAISLGLANATLTLTPWQYLRRDARGALTCQAGFAAVSLPVNAPGAPTWLLGDVFLGAYTSVFDIGNAAVGFAPALPPPRVTTRQVWAARTVASRLALLAALAAVAYALAVDAWGLAGAAARRGRA